MSDEYDGLEEVAPGQFAKRNADGQFIGGSLDSDEARRRVNARWDRENAANLSKAKRILSDRGIEWETADAAIQTLAEIGAEGKSGSVPAIRYLDKLTNRAPEDAPVLGETITDKMMLGKHTLMVSLGSETFINCRYVDVKYWQEVVKIARAKRQELENTPEA